MKLLEMVEHCGRWPQQACTNMFFKILKTVASERTSDESAYFDPLVEVVACASGFDMTGKTSCGGFFEHQRCVQFEGCVTEPLLTNTAVLFWVENVLFASSQGVLSEVMKLYTPLKLKVFMDGITAFMEGRNRELPGILHLSSGGR